MPSYKVTPALVEAIVKESHRHSIYKIAEKHNITPKAVKKILKSKAWGVPKGYLSRAAASPFPQEPEKTLAYNILQRAYLDLISNTDRTKRSAIRWFLSDKNDWLFSFVTLSDTLDYDVKSIRRSLRARGLLDG